MAKETKNYQFSESLIIHYLAWQEEEAMYKAAGLKVKLPEWYPKDADEEAALKAAAEKYKAERETK